MTFNIIYKKILYSHNFNLSQICYLIQAFDSFMSPIIPSDLTLNYNLSVLCFLNINNSINIYSLAMIEEDKYFECVEFSCLNETIKIGVIIYETSNNFTKVFKPYIIDGQLINNISKNDDIFNSSKINIKYNFFFSLLQNKSKLIQEKRLTNLYISKPIFKLKRDFVTTNQWNFVNIFG